VCGNSVSLGEGGEAFIWREEVDMVKSQMIQITVVAWVWRERRKRRREGKQGSTTCGPPSSRTLGLRPAPRKSLRQGADHHDQEHSSASTILIYYGIHYPAQSRVKQVFADFKVDCKE